MTVIGLDHVYVTVADIERSMRFYDPVMEALGGERKRVLPEAPPSWKQNVFRAADWDAKEVIECDVVVNF